MRRGKVSRTRRRLRKRTRPGPCRSMRARRQVSRRAGVWSSFNFAAVSLPRRAPMDLSSFAVRSLSPRSRSARSEMARYFSDSRMNSSRSEKRAGSRSRSRAKCPSRPSCSGVAVRRRRPMEFPAMASTASYSGLEDSTLHSRWWASSTIVRSHSPAAAWAARFGCEAIHEVGQRII